MFIFFIETTLNACEENDNGYLNPAPNLLEEDGYLKIKPSSADKMAYEQPYFFIQKVRPDCNRENNQCLEFPKSNNQEYKGVEQFFSKLIGRSRTVYLDSRKNVWFAPFKF